ncbi:hypothetical protein BY458DRAFT_525999 [Sporodiniella umbellata]|nr:hypothetical protein BY458DRAFT_525999 [Sporodiniella umbellata]
MTTLSFRYEPPKSAQYAYHNQCESATLSKLRDHCDHVSLSRGCQINLTTTKTKISPLINSTSYTVSLMGAADDTLTKARGDLLQQCLLKITLTLEISLVENMATDLFEDLKKNFLDVHINVTQPKRNYSSLVSENSAYIEIVGPPEQAEECRVRVLVLIDEMRDLKTERLNLPLKLHYLICGRKRSGLLPVIEETLTNIYFPSPFYQFPTAEDQEINVDIYITGEATQVARAKSMLNKLAAQKLKSMYHKDTELDTKKIDWLLFHRRDELRKMMHDNGAYIMFPAIGSGSTRVTVYAENRVYTERTLRALHLQACSVYEACFYFNNQDGPLDLHALQPPMNVDAFISGLSAVSGSMASYRPGVIQVLGSERDVRNAYQLLQDFHFIQSFHRLTVFQLESSQEHRDFISGKKNGKINKIMKTSGVKIRFEPLLNDYNFLIEVEGSSFMKALDGLTLLQEELPAEVSFYVPESYHKRIIGVGGKNIQRIMKKYGVFVKFSNMEEFSSLGGYYDNDDNVVARTPMKNQINLDNLRHSVMELVQPQDRSWTVTKFKIPFVLHRDLIHHPEVSEGEYRIVWPEAELGQSTVDLLSPAGHVTAAIQWLKRIVPDVYDLCLPPSDNYSNLVSSDAFKKIIGSIDSRYHIRIDTQQDKIRLHLKRDQIETCLPEALDILTDYFKAQRLLEIYPVQTNRYALCQPTFPTNLPWTPVTQEIPQTMPDTNTIRSIFSEPLRSPVVQGFPGFSSSNGIWTPSRF